MLPLKTILHATDFSEIADYGFRLASALARDGLGGGDAHPVGRQ
jgi:hypothetical protein